MKAIASFFSLVAAFFIGIVSMMLGWGLQPQNWGWIIGCWVALVLVMGMAGLVKDD